MDESATTSRSHAELLARIETIPFSAESVAELGRRDAKFQNWPVVYMINNRKKIYVGESVSAVSRMTQHIAKRADEGLETTRIILGETFNKSVCLDLESYLIRLFSGDGKYEVLNLNSGVTDADYFQRRDYTSTFEEIFDRLRADGLFKQTIPEIQNSDLFKLSPFKALNVDQEAVIDDILEGLFDDLAASVGSTAVVEGGAGTGKTIVAIYLLKLLVDIRDRTDQGNTEAESVFGQYFLEGFPELLRDAKLGLVVPQQSLRTSIRKVFARTPGLDPAMVLTPFDVAKSAEDFDFLVVDETHRLGQYAAQSFGGMTTLFRELSLGLARSDEEATELTQIDWVIRKSKHQLFLVDEGQGVRPNDVPARALNALRDAANERRYRLSSQMRVQATGDYLTYIREVLSAHPPREPQEFGAYDLRFFDDVNVMAAEIAKRNDEHSLARLAAGYAWPWKSKKAKPDEPIFDIEIGDFKRRWNGTDVDWVNSANSIYEVGSIHTLQGYDLNYTGVIIGPDLYYDTETGAIAFDRMNYFDKKGKQNNKLLKITYSDDDILEMVKNIYSVLLTRGIRGTYVYVHDDALREHLRPYFTAGKSE